MVSPLLINGLDGGGVKGLTTLLILKRIMRTVRLSQSSIDIHYTYRCNSIAVNVYIL